MVVGETVEKRRGRRDNGGREQAGHRVKEEREKKKKKETEIKGRTHYNNYTATLHICVCIHID